MAAQTVLAVLGRGADNARSLGAIAEQLGWSRRVVEKAVQALRLDGKAVASGSDGIWLTDAAAELDATHHMLVSRLQAQAATADAVKATADRMRGSQQTELWRAA